MNEERTTQSSQSVETSKTDILRALIVPAKIGVDAAQKRRGLRGAFRDDILQLEGWDDLVEAE